MRFLITTVGPDGRNTYTAIGNRDALIDAAYDAGALGVTALVLP